MTPNDEQEEIINRLNALADEARSAKEKKIINRAKFLQELSYERELTQAEKDEFVKLVKENPDIEDALIVLSKTGFARPGNHTGRTADPDDEQGNRLGYQVEIPPFAYTRDPHITAKEEREAEAAARAEAEKEEILEKIREKLAQIPDGQELTNGQFNQLISVLPKEDKDDLYNEFVADAEKNWGDDTKNLVRELQFINNIFGKRELKYKGEVYSKQDAKKMTMRDIANVLGITHVGASKIMKRAVHKMAVEIARRRGIKDEKQIEALENILRKLK